jgi:hypothetical protein
MVLASAVLYTAAMLEGLAQFLGEVICSFLGAFVLWAVSGGKWKPGRFGHFVEGVVGGLFLLVLLMLVGGIAFLIYMSGMLRG